MKGEMMFSVVLGTGKKMGFGVAGMVLALAISSFAAPAPIFVVKYAKGNLKMTSGNPAVQKDLQQSELVGPGTKIEAGADGKAVFRLLPDQAFMEVRPRTVFTVKRVKIKDMRVRRVTMEAGELVFGLKKKSEPVQCENELTQATAAAGKFSCRSNEKGVGTFLVQDGELSVYNRRQGSHRRGAQRPEGGFGSERNQGHRRHGFGIGGGRIPAELH